VIHKYEKTKKGKKENLSFIPMAFTTLKTKQSLERLRPKPQARTEELYKKME